MSCPSRRTSGQTGPTSIKGYHSPGIRRKLGPGGSVECEEDYQNGLRCGLSREWYRSGSLYHEAVFLNDVVHGTEREWYENGQLHERRECEYGIVTRETVWDEQGNEVSRYELHEGDPSYRLLQASERASAASP